MTCQFCRFGRCVLTQRPAALTRPCAIGSWEPSRNLFVPMYVDYCRDLSRLCGRELGTTRDYREWCLELIVADRLDATWTPLTHGRDAAGFVVTLPHPQTLPSVDCWIDQAYVVPRLRRRGLMTSALEALVAQSPGRYGISVLRGNDAALAFWTQAFDRLGYGRSPLELPESLRCQFDDTTRQFLFSQV